MMGRRKEVDAWFAKYDNPMKDVVQRVRALVLAADKRIDECIKWQAPTFTYKGNLASFFPKSKQHASLMFHLGAHIPGKHPRLEAVKGDTGKIMKIATVEDADAAKPDLEAVVKAWIAWRDSEAKPKAKPAKTRTKTKPKPKAKPKAAKAKAKPKRR